MTERLGASHRITQTRSGSGNSADVPRRTHPIEKWKDTGSGSVASEADDYGEHGLSSQKVRGGGHVGQVETLQPVIGGQERSTYQTGAFATPVRAQIGAESLSRRITKRGGSEVHHVGTSFESYEDMMPEGASMRRRH